MTVKGSAATSPAGWLSPLGTLRSNRGGAEPRKISSSRPRHSLKQPLIPPQFSNFVNTILQKYDFAAKDSLEDAAQISWPTSPPPPKPKIGDVRF